MAYLGLDIGTTVGQGGPLRRNRAFARIEPGGHAGEYRKYFQDYKNLNRLLMPTFGGKS